MHKTGHNCVEPENIKIFQACYSLNEKKCLKSITYFFMYVKWLQRFISYQMCLKTKNVYLYEFNKQVVVLEIVYCVFFYIYNKVVKYTFIVYLSYRCPIIGTLPHLCGLIAAKLLVHMYSSLI